MNRVFITMSVKRLASVDQHRQRDALAYARLTWRNAPCLVVSCRVAVCRHVRCTRLSHPHFLGMSSDASRVVLCSLYIRVCMYVCARVCVCGMARHEKRERKRYAALPLANDDDNNKNEDDDDTRRCRATWRMCNAQRTSRLVVGCAIANWQTSTHLIAIGWPFLQITSCTGRSPWTSVSFSLSSSMWLHVQGLTIMCVRSDIEPYDRSFFSFFKHDRFLSVLHSIAN